VRHSTMYNRIESIGTTGITYTEMLFYRAVAIDKSDIFILHRVEVDNPLFTHILSLLAVVFLVVTVENLALQTKIQSKNEVS